MTLKDYFSQNQEMDDAKFAALVGCDRSTIYRIRENGQTPTRKLMKRIALATDGAVQPNDFYGLSGLAA
jgi:transcriptional regulator with XRE-family HTH domain